jgi:hypothetical protein
VNGCAPGGSKFQSPEREPTLVTTRCSFRRRRELRFDYVGHGVGEARICPGSSRRQRSPRLTALKRPDDRYDTARRSRVGDDSRFRLRYCRRQGYLRLTLSVSEVPTIGRGLSSVALDIGQTCRPGGQCFGRLCQGDAFLGAQDPEIGRRRDDKVEAYVVDFGGDGIIETPEDPILNTRTMTSIALQLRIRRRPRHHTLRRTAEGSSKPTA